MTPDARRAATLSLVVGSELLPSSLLGSISRRKAAAEERVASGGGAEQRLKKEFNAP